jgi:hypothetical protein
MVWLGDNCFFFSFGGRAKRSLLSLCSFSSISNKFSLPLTYIQIMQVYLKILIKHKFIKQEFRYSSVWVGLEVK